MATVTKKELIDHIAAATGQKRVVSKSIVHTFLNTIGAELDNGNRLEFRDSGVIAGNQTPDVLFGVALIRHKYINGKRFDNLIKKCLVWPALTSRIVCAAPIFISVGVAHYNKNPLI